MYTVIVIAFVVMLLATCFFGGIVIKLVSIAKQMDQERVEYDQSTIPKGLVTTLMFAAFTVIFLLAAVFYPEGV